MTVLPLLAVLALGADKPPLTLDTIREVVHEHRAQIHKCYDASGAGKKKVPGKVVVRFVISDEGRVSETEVKESTIDDEGLKACVVSSVKTWVFPKPKHGPAGITFPFHFGPPAKEPFPAPEPVE